MSCSKTQHSYSGKSRNPKSNTLPLSHCIPRSYQCTKSKVMVDVPKFETLLACQNSLDKQCRPRSNCFFRSSLIWVFPVCFFDKCFLSSSPENQQFIWEQKVKSVPNQLTRIKSQQQRITQDSVHLLYHHYTTWNTIDRYISLSFPFYFQGNSDTPNSCEYNVVCQQ